MAHGGVLVPVLYESPHLLYQLIPSLRIETSSNFTALEAPVISVLAICRLHSRKESPLEELVDGLVVLLVICLRKDQAIQRERGRMRTLWL